MDKILNLTNQPLRAGQKASLKYTVSNFQFNSSFSVDESVFTIMEINPDAVIWDPSTERFHEKSIILSLADKGIKILEPDNDPLSEEYFKRSDIEQPPFCNILMEQFTDPAAYRELLHGNPPGLRSGIKRALKGEYIINGKKALAKIASDYIEDMSSYLSGITAEVLYEAGCTTVVKSQKEFSRLKTKRAGSFIFNTADFSVVVTPDNEPVNKTPIGEAVKKLGLKVSMEDEKTSVPMPTSRDPYFLSFLNQTTDLSNTSSWFIQEAYRDIPPNFLNLLIQSKNKGNKKGPLYRLYPRFFSFEIEDYPEARIEGTREKIKEILSNISQNREFMGCLIKDEKGNTVSSFDRNISSKGFPFDEEEETKMAEEKIGILIKKITKEINGIQNGEIYSLKKAKRMVTEIEMIEKQEGFFMENADIKELEKYKQQSDNFKCLIDSKDCFPYFAAY